MNPLNTVGAQSAIDPYTASAATNATKQMGRDSFLQLLVVQLQHQDPLNPMDDKDFTAQLAQFSSLEALENINDGVQSLNDGNTRQDVLGAVSFIGKDIRAEGYNVSTQGDSVSTVYYELESPVADMVINVYDDAGNLMASKSMGASQAGSYQFVWDGKDYNGNEVPDGVYNVAIAAEDKNGKPVYVQTEVNGTVSGVSTENGQTTFRLSDGRQVNFLNVKEIVGSAGSGTTANSKS